MRNTIISTAVLAALISSPTFAEESFSPDLNFFGYARAGMHSSPDSESGNGHPDYIKADGANGKYRLGNEDDWAEFGLSSTVYKSGAQRAEVGIMIGTWHDAQGNFGDSFDIMQAWGQLYGVFGSDITSIWAGKRYPRGLADDMLDFKYWENVGRGFGIRDIETSRDWLVDVTWNYDNGDFDKLVDDGEGGFTTETGKTGVHLPEVRLHNIDFLNGKLILGANFAFVMDDTELKENVSDPDTTGYMFTVSHSGQFGGMHNTLSLQYSGGIGVSGWTSEDMLNIETPGQSFRVMNHGTYFFNDTISMPYSLGYETISMDNVGDDGKDYFNIGIRPTYSWSSFTQTLVEIGYQQATSDAFSGTNTTHKATLAQQFAFGAVPRVRLYATYAEKDTKWREDSFGSHSSFNEQLDSWTFGAMFEAWW
ncbi:carbohydrate porin [Photobacterium sp. BZF1]|uniref:carbohydrate porin n=1 Tax=Photobacterium sp. BZF1 TaxID=1904457 RepID=UPI001653E897|nr:carbohydrate porin [Photobacterium sp. BZF1]MBC7002406.1 carbohydrate porin [Photobacterium sp. BZF1]